MKHILACHHGSDTTYIGRDENNEHDWVTNIEDAYVFKSDEALQSNMRIVSNGYEVIFTVMPDIDLLVNL